MQWFNVWGLVFVAVIMIPNIIFAAKCKDGFESKWHNKTVEVFEQIGRFGCFGFMIINYSENIFRLAVRRRILSLSCGRCCSCLRILRYMGGLL